MTELARELEQTRARERAAVEQVALLERRLVESERVAARAVALEHELAELRRTADARIEALDARVHELERVNRELDATAEHFRTLNDAMRESVSWKATRPLRAIKRS